MELSDALKTKLLAFEESLLKPEVRGNPKVASDLLAPEFIEIGKSGTTFDKPQTLEAMATQPLDVRPTIEEFEARPLANHVVLVTYRCNSTKRSSIWRQESGKWQIVFHQGTPYS